jgi:hypothetical protein
MLVLKKVFLVITVVFLVWFFIAYQQPGIAGDVVLNENFDTTVPTGFGRKVIAHRHTELAPQQGVTQTQAIKVNYVGDKRGSQRIVVSSSITPQAQASLSFAVKFCPDFDFARGGKLHGLGPERPVAGGNAVTEDRWSARLMWRRGGGLMTYVYHQDMKGKYGDTRVAPGFNFSAGQYYNLKMTVKLNTKPVLADGYIEVKVDDKTVIYHDKLRFRSTESTDGLIQTLMFNTFYGGSSPDWAPRHVDGSFKTDCAYFDDFKVVPEAVTAGVLK